MGWYIKYLVECLRIKYGDDGIGDGNSLFCYNCCKVNFKVEYKYKKIKWFIFYFLIVW